MTHFGNLIGPIPDIGLCNTCNGRYDVLYTCSLSHHRLNNGLTELMLIPVQNIQIFSRALYLPKFRSLRNLR